MKTGVLSVFWVLGEHKTPALRYITFLKKHSRNSVLGREGLKPAAFFQHEDQHLNLIMCVEQLVCFTN